MRRFRTYTLVVSLSVAIVLVAAVSGTSPAANGHRSLDDSIITEILEFFGIDLQSRISFPPGVTAQSRLSTPPG